MAKSIQKKQRNPPPAEAIEIPPEGMTPRRLAAIKHQMGLMEKSAVVRNHQHLVKMSPPAEIPAVNQAVEERARVRDMSFADRNRIAAIAAERYRRRHESLRLWMPMKGQLDFHKLHARERTVIGSNRSGKTTCAAVDVAWIVTGTHPWMSGKTVTKTGGMAALIGFDWDHVGRVLYKKLFAPGAYRIIRDEITNKWRPYSPDKDQHRRGESKEAPPLIPPRMIKKIAWKRKALNQPKMVTLVNGWVLHFFSSEGEPPQGDAFDLAWFDEEIQHSGWYEEFVLRLVDNEGYFIWSATPHVGGDDLIDLHNRAVDGLTSDDPKVRETHLTLLGNQHISAKAKQLVIEKFKHNPEAYRVRVLGEFAAKAFKVYSEYSPTLHNFDPMEVWAKTGGQCPHDWCKYVAVDPGRTRCAILFLAVPPPEFGEGYYVYDEICIEQCNPTKFAAAVEAKTRGQTYEVFLMDMHAGRSRGTAGGKSVEEQYHEALQEVGKDKVNVWKRFKNACFWAGADDLDAGIDEVKTQLFIDDIFGVPRLRTAKARLPNLEQDFDRYQYKKERDGRMSKKPRDKWHDFLDCLRYLAGFRPTWQQPKPAPKPKSWAVRRFQEKSKRNSSSKAGGVVNFGPGSGRLKVAQRI